MSAFGDELTVECKRQKAVEAKKKADEAKAEAAGDAEQPDAAELVEASTGVDSESDGGITEQTVSSASEEEPGEASKEAALLELAPRAVGPSIHGVWTTLKLARDLSLESDFILNLLAASCDALDAIRGIKEVNDGYDLVRT